MFDGETGDVIGLAESRFDDERAIGFATPVDIIARFLRAHPRR
jgi:S1-C subfamily serine protease